MKSSYFTIIILVLFGIFTGSAQQDSQYTQYMYNTQIVNPAYAGTGDVLSFGLLLRTQWVSLEGAPKTGSFSINSPLGLMDNMGIGLSVVHDELGPSVESNINVDFAYAISTSDTGEISFGLKAGLDILDVDFSKLNLNPNTPDSRFENNIDNKLQPQIGAGVYFNTEKFYLGASVPNFLTTKHFDTNSLTNTQSSAIAAERLHYFLIAGYVFDLSDNLKFKPATLVKAVSGAPLQWDASANFLINEKFTVGASYRWSAAVSAMLGFQASKGIFIGFGYDYQTTDLEEFSDGSYELILRYDLFNKAERFVTPRFF
ncbi:PorP/SprF family type IX secretion system membrane protein [Ulvibacter antarcticus]|uniref:Type IX secretion system PorP/SprF family membrane protein n=1 Tax=Ulvibacter antarcticus TaxID=442714 RepID=A0A3L9YKD7_9FLAO|nr:type IX secretion system membrane protein PorP/SprF [Ulvibacter antarcticus]RMA58458.1 type IX secretion system PorP/SprF family membrane protein [Ulvibacter antarcticus]